MLFISSARVCTASGRATTGGAGIQAGQLLRVRALALANYPLDVSATRTSRAANLQPVGRVPLYL